MTTLTKANPPQRGTYVSWLTSDGVLQIQILCPDCGHANSISDDALAACGETWQAFDCAYCPFSDVLILAGFTGD